MKVKVGNTRHGYSPRLARTKYYIGALMMA